MSFRVEALGNERFAGALNDFERYQSWRADRANEAVARLDSIYPVQDRQFLDYGCGYGSLSKALLEKGAKVIPVEVDSSRLKVANRYLNGFTTPILIGPEGLPLKSESVDGVVSMDVLEHVEPKFVSRYIEETFRVLKPEGLFYAEMTPYYSFAGHHLLQYTPLPIHLFLPQPLIKGIVYGSHKNGFKSTDEIWQQFITLNKVHVSEVQKLLKDYKISHEGFVFKVPGLFKAEVPLLGKMGGVGEFFTLSYEVIAEKSRDNLPHTI